MTLAPSAAAARATARPIPPPPPVTATTLPSRNPAISHSCSLRDAGDVLSSACAPLTQVRTCSSLAPGHTATPAGACARRNGGEDMGDLGFWALAKEDPGHL